MEQATYIWKRATWENVGPTVSFGTSCGIVSGITGSFWALYRPYPRPGLFAFLCFLQYGTYGTLFHGSRAYYLQSRPFSNPNFPSLPSPPPYNSSTSPESPPTLADPPTRSDLLTYSTLGGATSGFLLNAIFRQRFILSGTLQLAFYGFLGQRVFLWVDDLHSGKVERDAERRRRLEAGEREPGLFETVAGYAGMRKMSDEEYINVLEERALAVEVDIALVDDQIEELRKEERGE